MDARTAELPVTLQQQSWLKRERASGRFYDRLAVVIAAFLIGVMALSVWLLQRGAEPGTLLSPPLIALLLIAILMPAIALMALYARKMAVRRAEQGGLGSGQLHVRLVALFTAIAAVPTVLVAIFASLLFQSGLEFWFSNRARSMLENTVQVAQASLSTASSIGWRPKLSRPCPATSRIISANDDRRSSRFAEAFASASAEPAVSREAIIFTYRHR